MTCSSSGNCQCPFGSPGCDNSACLGWGFESGVGTWHPAVGGNAISSISSSTLHPTDGGSKSIAFGGELTPTSNSAIIETALCTSGSTSVVGLRPGLEIMVDHDAVSLNVDWVGKSGATTVTGTIHFNLMAARDKWYTVDGDAIPSGTVPFDTFQIVVSSNTNWGGQINVDNIQFH